MKCKFCGRDIDALTKGYRLCANCYAFPEIRSQVGKERRLIKGLNGIRRPEQ